MTLQIACPHCGNFIDIKISKGDEKEKIDELFDELGLEKK